MEHELPKHYDFASEEPRIYQRWLKAAAFAAVPGGGKEPFVIMMPLPNVTGALHLGHAMDNVMQDLLIRRRRMQGRNALWMPGTDHAGIATQAVVEKRLFELEGKTRHDLGREALVARIWAWKDEYQGRIIEQLQQMGCSCDWNRKRFTMDAVCTRAVRDAFFRLFRDGLIYRGYRLVNWDCQLQTVIADDEIEYEKVQGHFWHMRYPIVDPRPGEPEWVVVATTRPETMLGDTAVAVHPDPRAALDSRESELRSRLSGASRKERDDMEAELGLIERRRTELLANLLLLRDMARSGRKLLLPLLRREIPLILDEWAKPGLGSGCVKITPAHDPNDYQVWERHAREIGIINILNPDGTLNDNAGPYAGRDRFDARRRVIDDLQAQGLIELTEDRETEVGHSDRSRTPVEPYLSRQWFVRMGDVQGGIVCGQGTPKTFRTAGLAQAAIDAADPGWSSPSGRRLTFHPDAERYGGTYRNWLSEKRDWCISRQLWWGHRIPIWHASLDRDRLLTALGIVARAPGETVCAWIVMEDGTTVAASAIDRGLPGGGLPERADLLVCLRNAGAEETTAPALEAAGLTRDPDVLDTWFSSALWPFSTLGWPDPETAPIDPGQSPLGAADGRPDCLSYFYPGSVLVTGRDIITLWVARMHIMGLYLLGDVPFTDCFIHANVQDGKGERMSKSKGNGIDPVDIITRYGTDALRYIVCEMQTGTQDIRLPVQAISPFTGEPVELATAKHGRTVFTYLCPKTGKEFDVLGTIPDLPAAKVTCERFEIGRAFCTKLWNAARFAFINLGQHEFRPVAPADLAPEDRWILSRLSAVVARVDDALEQYNPSAAIGTAREFFWSDLCDWYLELIKPRMRDERSAPVARAVLALAMDQVLRLFHPFVPFITETLWEKLAEQCPVRGLEAPIPSTELLIQAPWPLPHPEWEDLAVETDMAALQDVIRAIRDLRARYGVPPRKPLRAWIKASGPAAESLARLKPLVVHMTQLESLDVGPDLQRPALAVTHVTGAIEIYLGGVVDPEKERARLLKQLEKARKDKAGMEGRLSNERFVSKAPAEVVTAERKKLAAMADEIALLEKNLRELNGEPG